MTIETWPEEEYNTLNVGDRFTAMLMGYQRTYRVVKVEYAIVLYPNDKQIREKIVTTKSGLVWSTHVSGALLSFYGRYGIDYKIAYINKMWLQHVLDKGERRTCRWALGES